MQRLAIFVVAAALTVSSALCGTADFVATVTNPDTPTGKAPEGMVWIPGGEFSMGAAINGEGNGEMPMASNDSQPLHRVYVDGFWMDATSVTNAQFEKFVRATRYVTIAERRPTKEEFPTAPEENLVAGAVVFAPTDHEVQLNDHYQWWSYVKSANWRHPLGPQSDIKGNEKYPVVQIAYPDAEAYAKWAGKQSPNFSASCGCISEPAAPREQSSLRQVTKAHPTL
jgi:formylglycine-generating enzyme required for sulfatase activity